MDYTRQPIIETVITPKEGCKLVVRSSKSTGQEEYFVDALEVVSFGNALFFRSVERPKAFLVPASDYEVLEVREARMVLKNVGVERGIKIGGGREAPPKLPKEPPAEKIEPVAQPAAVETAEAEGRPDKRRDKRRQARRKRGPAEEIVPPSEGEPSEAAAPAAVGVSAMTEEKVIPSNISSPLLTPPPTLISETIARYKDNAIYRGAFYMKEAEEQAPSAGGELTPEEVGLRQTHPEDILEAIAMQSVSLEPPAYTFGVEEESNELIPPPEQRFDISSEDNFKIPTEEQESEGYPKDPF